MENGHDPAPFTIRDATLLDLPAIRQLWGQLLEEGQGTITYPIVTDQTGVDVLTLLARAIAQPTPLGRIIVADVGGKVCGFVAGEIAQRGICEPKHYLFGHFLIVDPAYRKQDIGRALVREFVTWGQRMGVTYGELSTTTHGPDWERRGWTPYATVYYTSLDAIVRTLDAPRVIAEEPSHDVPQPTEP